MTTLSLEDVVAPLEAYAPTTPRALLRRVFVDAARRFCRDTTAWRKEVVAAAGTTPDVYILAPPPGAEVFQATSVWHGSTCLQQSTRAQFQPEEQSNASPVAFRVGGPNRLYVTPKPAASIWEKLVVIAALQPMRDALDVDSDLLDAYADALFDGAAWRLMLFDGPFYNPSMAEYHRRQFEASISYYRSLASDDGQVGVPRATGYGGY